MNERRMERLAVVGGGGLLIVSVGLMFVRFWLGLGLLLGASAGIIALAWWLNRQAKRVQLAPAAPEWAEFTPDEQPAEAKPDAFDFFWANTRGLGMRPWYINLHTPPRDGGLN